VRVGLVRSGGFGVCGMCGAPWRVRGALVHVGVLARSGGFGACGLCWRVGAYGRVGARAGRLGVCGACWHVQGALVRACASAGVRAGGGGGEVGCGDLQASHGFEIYLEIPSRGSGIGLPAGRIGSGTGIYP